jgi:hypothetical protein
MHYNGYLLIKKTNILHHILEKVQMIQNHLKL